MRARNDEELLLDENPYYWDSENVAVEGLKILFLEDSEDVMGRFNRFEIDWIVSGMGHLPVGGT
jgi:ABC-type oligopeptide transport system substrate-binding subunit